MCFPFHNWREYLDWNGHSVKRYYRECIRCGKWQYYISTIGMAWWEDCDKPPIKLATMEEYRAFPGNSSRRPWERD